MTLKFKLGANQPLGLWRQDWLLTLLLVIVTMLAYLPAWNGTPIWDDDAHLTKQELRSLEGLARIWTQPGATQQYYPLVHTLFWVEHQLWGDWPAGYHLLNILLTLRFSLAPGQNFATAADSGGLAGGCHLRAASHSSGIGSLDLRTQEHAFRSVLFRVGAGLPEV